MGGKPRLSSRTRTAAWFAATAVCALLAPGTAQAQIGSYRYSSIVLDEASGKITEAVNADAQRYPASLTKLMTLYMVFEALRDHRISLRQMVPISAHTASMEPSKLGLVPGSRMTVEEGILAMVTKSANDAACAMGELVGGDENRFAQMMTLRARSLGMTHSTFRNASGLPDPQQMTTARDLAVLAHHLIKDFPDQYHYFSVASFPWHGHEIPNHDHMLTDYEGADGLKTGYTVAAGHNLVTSAVRGGVRLIGVVLGASSNGERDLHMASLLDDGFTQMGVPIAPRAPHHFHLPSLMSAADAAPIRGHGRFHVVHGRLTRYASHTVSAKVHAVAPAAHGAAAAGAACRPHSAHHACHSHHLAAKAGSQTG